MLGFNVFAADTDEAGHFLATSMQQAFVNLRSARPKALQPPVEGYMNRLGAQEKAMLQQVLSCSAIGSPATVKRALQEFIAQTGADELMITSQIFDHAARLHSYDITADLRAAAG
jgi:alkanesulfonate monooxygenase SsuD/methylene tetrahydromethanopterin reductase-like flavin-dependent oxidoreductase (luciferase family)